MLDFERCSIFRQAEIPLFRQAEKIALSGISGTPFFVLRSSFVPPLSFAILTVCSKCEFGGPSGLMVAVQMSMRKWADEVEARVI